jgi:hypothetical protein
MRKAFSQQRRLDCRTVLDVQLNHQCRDEIILILRALQHIYSQPELRGRILDLIAKDVNKGSRRDCGRVGMNYWQILVLAAVRLGCNLDYDKLQDLAEQHRALRHIMGIGDWEEETVFNWRRIQDNVTLIQPATIEKINHLIVGAGHRLVPEAAQTMRADSFVVETNIHYPTESSLMVDGIRMILGLCAELSLIFDLTGWRQHEHLLKKAQRLAHNIQRISSKKGAKYKERLQNKYRDLIELCDKILHRSADLLQTLELLNPDVLTTAKMMSLQVFMERTQQVRNTAERRMLKGEKVPNEDKLFSIFEPHTQLYRRGKAGQPEQFGRLALICEDAVGFIIHYYLLPRDAQDRDVVVPQMRIVQNRLGGRIQKGSFDRGFHSPENQIGLAEIIPHPCLPKPGAKQAIEQQQTATVQFRQSRQRHPGVESTIGALQSGNGLERCRDRTELGFERYLGLGVLGRNLHTLGKILIAQQHPHCHATESRRKQIA